VKLAETGAICTISASCFAIASRLHHGSKAMLADGHRAGALTDPAERTSRPSSRAPRYDAPIGGFKVTSKKKRAADFSSGPFLESRKTPKTALRFPRAL